MQSNVHYGTRTNFWFQIHPVSNGLSAGKNLVTSVPLHLPTASKAFGRNFLRNFHELFVFVLVGFIKFFKELTLSREVKILKMSTGTSTFVIRWINFLTMLLAVAVIGFGVWMSTHHDSCRKSLTLPVIGLGAVIFVISIVGFLGALKKNSILLWIYLILLCLILVAILVFTVLAFIVTNTGSGHNISGLRYKEYHLQDYSSWFLNELNNTQNWERLRSCLVKSYDCNNLAREYKTLNQYKLARLTPIEAGCCRPPSECGYPTVNASYYDLSFRPTSTNKDCKLYKNTRAIKCYSCDSCKAGVAQYMKIEWRVVAIFNVFLFFVLSIIYFVGCCARRNAAQSREKV